MTGKVAAALGVISVVLSSGARAEPRSPPAPAVDALLIEIDAASHLSQSAAYALNARLMVGVGVAVDWRIRGRIRLVGSIRWEGFTDGSLAFNAAPVGLGVRYRFIDRPTWTLHGRGGLALAREWVDQATPAGTFASENFATTRVDVGLGGGWKRGRNLLGAELRAVSLSRWESFGDASGYPAGEGPVPRAAAGTELGLFYARALR